MIFLLMVNACDWDYTPSFDQEEVLGFAPVYASAEEMEIALLPPQDLVNPGKIYTYGDYLLVNERMAGIHIIDNSDPENPVNLHFLRIAGNIDMVLKGNFIYADQTGSLLTIDVSNTAEVKLVNKINNVFNAEYAFPEARGVYFECVDASKGTVVAWEQKILNNPKCYR